MKKATKGLAIALMLIVAAAFTLAPQQSFAASKTKKMTVYNVAIKSGNKVYCNGTENIYRVDLKKKKVLKRLHTEESVVEDVKAMKKKGKYVYFLFESYYDKERMDLYRVSIYGGKEKRLAKNVCAYAISDGKIYYTHFKKWNDYGNPVGKTNKVMKLNGKSKKSTRYKVKMKEKSSNAKGYKIKYTYKKNSEKYKVWLKTPRKKIYLATEIGS